MALTLLEAAITELGPVLARAGVALLGGATVAGTASLSGDTPKEDSKATPDVRALPRTGESCKKCPPDAGARIRRNHGVNWNSYRYQARITGFPFDTEACRWSEEWDWLGVDFDGFQPGECMLQETKGNYDQFLDGSIPGAEDFFRGFDKMETQITTQASKVRANPPARLTWYFQTPLTRRKMAPLLASLGVRSVYQP
ncbi:MULTISPECIES: restriction endonuclease fold toxin 5 domain-containing protein [pseudomallei group]|uniref:restriction endonuclease fold toxin 5 domain-containing protein n=1 Tax=pseudomallei group TaxID=111527 RepID=UPI001593F136|nr:MULTISPECIES: restriction endonuclease fold toxin 5 domain-containing protein [pseudomallei group]MCQ8222246.1 restriction endonuclease fold toxin 5 domain-containing protein [Burkholderia pseudomallei]MCW0096881.1 restriction endonuclease fold toxin 5 domain-containing protein [Burkholderia pseudomallei]MDV2104664.1 restriction endonuclease fold toxin 5 domain-containing protein [Burkholderia pseudomallei]MDV2184420.1 restriction endonuclease fold toxin 5 domain-containing protein [Burkhold